jgi:predicted glycosyltransferase
MKVLFHVQHLLGIGHLRRAATLAGALAREGMEVTLASGGVPVPGMVPPGVRLVQLPPAAAEDGSFRHLVDETGRRADDAWREKRRAILLDAYAAAAPDLLVIELFPFGRRQLAFELLPLLERARGRSRIVSSVRDLIQDKPARHDEMVSLVERYFDLVLVHGDARLAAFPLAARLREKIRYTGYVVDEPHAGDAQAGRGEVIVSAGGGAVGARLLETALRARELSSLRDRTWRVITGVNGPDLKAVEDKNLVIERMRTDFTTLLANCALSISQAGYNTVMETLQARARAVLVPYVGEGESEQPARARLLAAHGLVEVVEEASLDAASLAAAAGRAASRSRPPAGAVDLGGAQRSAELLRELLPA